MSAGVIAPTPVTSNRRALVMVDLLDSGNVHKLSDFRTQTYSRDGGIGMRRTR
jgi:hypothetical protein